MDDVEVWEPASGAWRSLPPLDAVNVYRSRSSGSLLTDSRFAVFGGHIIGVEDEGVTWSCKALVLDNGAERWESLPRMLETRADFACEAVGGCVIVAGGASNDVDSGVLSSTEVYEEATGVWWQLPCNLPQAMVDMGSALL